MDIPRMTKKIEVPAPTAWPIVLAFGLTLVVAGFVTAASVSILGAVVGGHRRGWLVPPGAARRVSRVGARRSRRDRDRDVPGKRGTRHGSGPAHLAACRDLSDFRRCQRRPCRRCGDGGARRGLRDLERQRDLVSDEPPGSRTVSQRGNGDCQPDRDFQPAISSWSPFRFTC